MKKSRRKFSSKFKTKVVLEALKEREKIQQLASRYELHPNQISIWKQQFLEGSERVFEEKLQSKAKESEQIQEKLYKKIGQLQVENDFLKKVLARAKSSSKAEGG